MDAPRYIYPHTNGKPSRPSGVRFLKRVILPRRFKSGDGPFDFSINGNKTEHGRQRKDAITYLGNALERGKVGDHFRAYDRRGDLVFAAKGAMAAAHVIDTSGNDKIDAVWTYEKTHYPGISFLGAFVCKFIVGTTEHSQHSYGNAVDCGGVSMDRMRIIAHDLVHHADELHLENVIVADTIWTRGVGFHPYTGEYHYHVHADCSPSINPALPCGVKG